MSLCGIPTHTFFAADNGHDLFNRYTAQLLGNCQSCYLNKLLMCLCVGVVFRLDTKYFMVTLKAAVIRMQVISLLNAST